MASVPATVAMKLSVATTHVDYDDSVDIWQRCRDVIEGSDAVKEKAELYLPKLPGHDADAYLDYKKRAMFYGAVKRTIKGMSGMVFMKDPAIEGLPDELDYLLADADFAGNKLAAFSKQVFTEVISLGRAGILVDMPKIGAPEQRPYMICYEAEQIINWREERINGRMTTQLVVLQETYEEVDPADPFVTAEYDQFRVLELITFDELTGIAYTSPVYRMRIFRSITDETDKEKAGYFLHESIIPVKNGEPLNFIPFYPTGPEENSFKMQQPPVLDMVDVVLSHYRTSADLENGRHWCGTPQPWMAGFPDKPEYQIGGDQIWTTSEPDARAEMLEFKGTGLGALEKALEEKEAKLAVLGMRLLETQRKGQEQPEALRIRMLGDVSTLAGIVTTVSQALTQALFTAVAWAMPSEPKDLKLSLNTDYDDVVITAQDLQTLITLWQSDGISYQTLYANLQRSKIARDGVSAEVEHDLIQEEREESEQFARDLNPNYGNLPPEDKGGQPPQGVPGEEGQPAQE